MTTALAASIIYVAWFLKNKDRLLRRIIAAISVSTVLYALIYWLDGGLSFALIMPAGQLADLIYGLVIRERVKLLPEACIYLCADMAFLPLFLCGGQVWEYAVYPAVLLLFLMITLIGEKNGHIGQSRQTGKTDYAAPMDFYTEKKYYYIVSFIPCLLLAPEMLILIVFRDLTVLSAMMTSAAFMILLCLALWLQYEFIHRKTAEEMSRAMNRWQFESRDYMNTIRSQRHDFNLHLHAISGLLSSDRYDKCNEYINKLVSEANAVNDIMPVNDAVVGSMLYNMREEARRKGSDIIYDITYDMADILCNGFECNKIIGNLLQNAIDALQTDEDKKYGIRLSIFKRRGNTVIVSENRFTGDPGKIAGVFEAGYSTKKGHEGIGLAMVLRTVRMYGGRIYPEFDDNIIRFVVNIPNKVNLLEEDRE